MFNKTKFYIGPMSKNVVDSVIEFAAESGNHIGFIPSRRQIDYDGGYVNNWNTKKFCEYVRPQTSNILLCRDHGGENQGQIIDDGMTSFTNDCTYLDLIHIDPFKTSENIYEASQKTKNIIEKLWNINPNIFYEVGTEEAIFKYSPKDLDIFLKHLKENLNEKQFNQIKYAVVQSGTGLDLSTRTNVGKFNGERLLNFVNVVKSFNLLSKEHNGDYLIDNSEVKIRFDIGLDAINIAPEFGQIESQFYLEECKGSPLFDILYKICFNSGRWKKWISDVTMVSKEQIIMTSCHYVLSQRDFIEKIKTNINQPDETIQKRINSKLKLLYG